MVSTEIIKEIYNIIQDEVFPVVDRRVRDWKYDNTGFRGDRLNGKTQDDMIEEVSLKLDELIDDVDAAVLNGALKAVALFRLYGDFDYDGAGSFVKSVRQLQQRKNAGAA